MNAVEIEEAVSALIAEPFDRQEFPFQFLGAFGFKETTIKKLRTGASNASDVPGAVLLRNNIHLVVADGGRTTEALTALKASPKTAKGKVKFILATDGETTEAEELATGEPLACPYSELADHFGFFLPLAGISTVAEIKDNPIDIKATGRLNKLYLQLLKENEDWATEAKRPALNQFMARLIFCFFAEDTGIFMPGLFTSCMQQMTDPQSTNTHEVIQKLFQAMDTPIEKRKAKKFPGWADRFPYVNGRLFTDSTEVPQFSKIARSYLIRAGELDWQQINPDIFGSMIQAVADDDERGSLGMHYTSVPNILKVLDPLFLDDLREQLEQAEDNPRKLLNLRKRIANIRVFDPACGSGNFLVIAYIKMREIEAEIIRRRDDTDKKSWIKLTNFYGIEIKSFPAEIARLALLIAEFQCNVRFIGQREACLDVLPLHDTGRIKTGNALREDWLEVCPPSQPAGIVEEDLAGPTGRLALDNGAATETYICGNPPFTGAREQSKSQKDDLRHAMTNFSGVNSLDYVCGWIWKSVRHAQSTDSVAAFVATNSLCQGQSIPLFWGAILNYSELFFAHRTFKWQNNATNNAAVHCVIVGLTRRASGRKTIFDAGTAAHVANISPYLTNNRNVIVQKASSPTDGRPELVSGNQAIEGGHLIFSKSEMQRIISTNPGSETFFRPVYGADDFVRNAPRYCIWVNEEQLHIASQFAEFQKRFDLVRNYRREAGEVATSLIHIPYRFRYVHEARKAMLIVPRTTTERRDYLPIGVLPAPSIVTDAVQVIYDPDIYVLAILSSKLHMSWVKAVAGRLKSDPRYSNTLVYNTFPIPPLTENQKAELTRCAEDILVAREHYFPATIADMYDPDRMDKEFPLVREAHERNDETLERIYIGRRFKNDTERLEKLFDMYTKMIKDEDAKKARSAPKKGRKSKSTANQEGDQA